MAQGGFLEAALNLRLSSVVLLLTTSENLRLVAKLLAGSRLVITVTRCFWLLPRIAHGTLGYDLRTDNEVLQLIRPSPMSPAGTISERAALMNSVLDDLFMVFLRPDDGDSSCPDTVEEPLAACPSYEEARRVLRQLRSTAQDGVIRFVGASGGGD